MSIINNNLLLAGTDEGYNLTRSLRFRRSASAYLNRTPSSAGNRKTFTWSGWVKRGVIGGSLSQTLMGGGTSDSSRSLLFLRDDNVLVFLTTSGTYYGTITTAVFRDPSAWYHIVCSVDTTQATTANRVRFYINNVEQTATSAYGSGYVPQNQDTLINAAVAQSLGGHPPYDPHDYFDGYLAEVNFIDGQALTPSSFGETDLTTGVWKPKRYAGTYGTNGFYLPFTDNSALTTSSNVGLGKDFSGNGNYWTTNNISITAGVTYDSMTDVPTLTSATAANFAVMNPLDTAVAPINGNLVIQGNNSWRGVLGSFQFPSSGLFYFEVNGLNSGQRVVAGIALPTISKTAAWQVTSGFIGAAADDTNFNFRVNGSGGFTIVSGYALEIIQVAVNVNTGNLWIGRNNTWYSSSGATTGNPATGANPSATGLTISNYFPAIECYDNGVSVYVNFGQRPFAYTPPTGFVALNTFNLPTSTIVKGNTVMDVTLWTGDGTSPRTITNASGFKPDLVWFKSRSATYYNQLADSVRGATKSIYSNVTNAEENNAINGYLSSINSNGFSVINGSSSGGSVNANGTTYVAWQWQAGQGTTSSNTSGTITSTVSVNASAGFSVVTYTGNGTSGATLGHGLGVAPSWIFIKSRSATGYWIVYTATNGATKYLTLNTTDAVLTNAGPFNNTAPTSSVFSVGNSADVNANGTTYVAYCFAPIAGYSAFGSYTGNGSADGTFVYTGFRPKFVMIKRTDAGGYSWCMYDTARDPYNAEITLLRADSSSGDVSPYALDGLSNGFKLRQAYDATNASGGTFIYMAFAEVPTKFALAR